MRRQTMSATVGFTRPACPTGVDDRSARALETSPSKVRRGDTDSVVRKATWLMRAIWLIVAAVLLFADREGTGTEYDVRLAALALTGLLMAAWVASDRSTTSRLQWAPWLPFVLGAITIASANASATPSGWPLVVFAFIATLSASSETSVITGWTILALGVLAVETGGLLYGSSSSIVFGFPLLLSVGFLAGHNRRGYRVQAEQSAVLLAQVEQLRVEQHRVDVLAERTRIAREIHDVLAHSLGALGVQIQAARAVLSDEHDHERVAELLGQAQRMASEGLTETRRAVHALRADTPPLPDVLAELAAAHRLRHGAPVTLHVLGQPVPLTPDANLALTRTAQETLVNSAKHAPRVPIDLCLDYDAERTTLTTTSTLRDGMLGADSGFESVNAGYGLTGLRERLLLLGGTLTAGPDSKQWVVTAQVPR
jgi:signal transduction histidine kinase